MNVYEIFGIQQNATDAEIKAAYEEAARRYGVFKTPQDMERFMYINAAYAVLSNPETRNQLERNGGYLSISDSQEKNTQPQSKYSTQSAHQPMGGNRTVPNQVIINNHYYAPQQQQIRDEFDFGRVLKVWAISLFFIGLMVVSFMV